MWYTEASSSHSRPLAFNASRFAGQILPPPLPTLIISLRVLACNRTKTQGNIGSAALPIPQNRSKSYHCTSRLLFNQPAAVRPSRIGSAMVAGGHMNAYK